LGKPGGEIKTFIVDIDEEDEKNTLQLLNEIPVLKIGKHAAWNGTLLYSIYNGPSFIMNSLTV
jgi:hypothetical protein